ncbi:MAG: DUF551 domain-containing protein [Eubacterium sp.]|nr:DUF551 domain-containing protein [Eubacterium sp.]
MQGVFEKIIENLENEYENLMEIYKTTNDISFYHTAQGVKKSIGIINQEESVYNNGWIPCSERWPENPHVTEYEEYPEYIVMIEGGDEPTTLQYAGDGKWFEQSDDSWYKVTAWQPLPAPYQQKGER